MNFLSLSLSLCPFLSSRPRRRIGLLGVSEEAEAMLGKRARAAWAGRWPEPIETTPRGWHRRTEEGGAAVVPASPLERDVRSPKGWMNRVPAGVGLGIVVALERTGGRGGVAAKAAVDTPATGTSTPAAASWKGGWWSSGVAGIQKSSLGGLFCGVDEEDDDGFHYRTLSSPSFSSTLRLPPVELHFFPGADFLSSCYLCKKKLHGGDIYMYR